MLPTLKSLQVFEAVARNKSFSLAAEELFVTQAAVSHQIKYLEQFLSTQLFTRLGRNLEITADGQALYEHTHSGLQHFRAGISEITSTKQRQEVVISLSHTFGAQWLSHRLPKFWKQHPNIELLLNYADSPLPPNQTGADISILEGDITTSNWQPTELSLLFHDILYPVAGPLLGAEISNINKLKKNCLLLLHTDKLWQQWFNKYSNESADKFDVKQYQSKMLHDQQTIIVALQQNMGVALSSIFLLDHDILTGRLNIPIKAPLLSSHSYYLGVAPNLQSIQSIQTVMAFLQQEASDCVANLNHHLNQ
ncbi:LysR family transcriptional regulator [Vibrio sp. S9_S30]|uniref:LysR family transcriptional regulator n=1 Tax=Vibrio sp. S9_S30 TaxID=2720226 RepID=UPI001680EB6F|nr:LysR family transcriptional regulator [Vibrio sp. S9_S30]MBD1557517.1 LysR family transcriptional regulator [Vibrio sp. S9_S30]